MRIIHSRTILSKRNVFNIYHGCTNNCLYCPVRSHLAGVKNFENVGVKDEAVTLLLTALRGKRKKCMLHSGTLGDPYQKLEDKTRLFRDVLSAVYEKGFGIEFRTRSVRALRDIDLLERINYETKAVVQVGLATADERLKPLLEPGSAEIGERLRMIEILNSLDIPVIIRLGPILPRINDGPVAFRDLLEMSLAANPTGSARR